MPKLYTRAEFRDRIRRKLGIVPPIDVVGSGAAPGDQPSNYPSPTNMQINDALIDAIADINRECQYHVETYNVPVSSTNGSAYGPFVLDMEDFTPNTSMSRIFDNNGHINDIQRVLWQPSGTGPSQLLEPVTRGQLDRNFLSQYYAFLPSNPQKWYVEAYKLYITPSQNVSGTYTITAGTGLVGLMCDDDVLDQCPEQWQNTFESQAIKRLSMMDTENVESQERYAEYGLFADKGIAQWQAWRHDTSGTPQPYLAFKSYRRGYGRMRTRR